MADKKQLEILKQGADAWNDWRRQNPLAVIDLIDADLPGADIRWARLSGANLARANLAGADMRLTTLDNAKFDDANLADAKLDRATMVSASFADANLNHASLVSVEITQSDLTRAKLNSTNLSKARLDHARFNSCDLNFANVSESVLRFSDFTQADAKHANFGDSDLLATKFIMTDLSSSEFTNARISGCVFSQTNFTYASGMAECMHQGRSSINFQTLENSGMLPLPFLRGCGLPDHLIEYIPSLIGKAFEFYSCFISYSHADRTFARRLHAQLQDRGIRCWLDEHDMLPGDDIHKGIQDGIRLWDKVLLCCSEASLGSWWVDNEIETAFAKERDLMKQRGRKILALIPLNLDGFMFKPDWNSGKREQIHSRISADFTGWEFDNSIFETQFERVVKALRSDDYARVPPPTPKL